MAKTKLTPRQWRLYIYLKVMFEQDPARYISKKDICVALPAYYQIDEKATRLCRSIEQDINILRNSHEIYRIIVSNSRGYKIATEQEADEWMHKIKMEAIAKLKMYSKNLKNAESNGQLRLVFNKEKGQIEVFN